jgi:hypothetical protein
MERLGLELEALSELEDLHRQSAPCPLRGPGSGLSRGYWIVRFSVNVRWSPAMS